MNKSIVFTGENIPEIQEFMENLENIGLITFPHEDNKIIINYDGFLEINYWDLNRKMICLITMDIGDKIVYKNGKLKLIEA